MGYEAIELLADASPNVRRYQVRRGDTLMTWRDVLDAWSGSDEFTDFTTQLLASGPFAEFRWETPSLVAAQLDEVFEFVLVESRGLGRDPDRLAFDAHFEPGQLVVQFSNLGGDCVLVVPCPVSANDDFSHLGAFLRSASTDQIRAFWNAVASAVDQEIGSVPLWLSTAGAGVAWLHVRLDDRPKYYSYAPYRSVGPDH